MSDINMSVISGRLVSEPELHYINRSGDSVAVCRFSIATTDKFGKTSFIPIIVWRNYGEAVANSLEQGQEVTVSGAWQSRKDKTTSRTYLELHANEVKFGPKAAT